MPIANCGTDKKQYKRDTTASLTSHKSSGHHFLCDMVFELVSFVPISPYPNVEKVIQESLFEIVHFYKPIY